MAWIKSRTAFSVASRAPSIAASESVSPKVSLVTGASRGIGRAIALELAAHGCKVGVNFSKSKDHADSLVQAIKDAGGDAMALQANVADAEAVDAMFRQVHDAWGTLDVLVNNAGIIRDAIVFRITAPEWRDVMDVNLTGTFLCTQKAARFMVKQRAGRIVNITSIAGLAGSGGQANYSAAKAGVIGFTKAVARELASRNVLVNAVAPGFIETDMTAESNVEEVTARIPLGRFGTPAEVAGLVRFLALDPAAQYITGQVFTIDGGYVI